MVKKIININNKLFSIKKGCKYSYSESISNINLNELGIKLFILKYFLIEKAIEGTSLQKGNLILKNPPLCPECGNPILAQVNFILYKF